MSSSNVNCFKEPLREVTMALDDLYQHRQLENSFLTFRESPLACCTMLPGLSECDSSFIALQTRLVPTLQQLGVQGYNELLASNAKTGLKSRNPLNAVTYQSADGYDVKKCKQHTTFSSESQNGSHQTTSLTLVTYKIHPSNVQIDPADASSTVQSLRSDS